MNQMRLDPPPLRSSDDSVLGLLQQLQHRLRARSPPTESKKSRFAPFETLLFRDGVFRQTAPPTAWSTRTTVSADCSDGEDVSLLLQARVFAIAQETLEQDGDDGLDLLRREKMSAGSLVARVDELEERIFLGAEQGAGVGGAGDAVAEATAAVKLLLALARAKTGPGGPPAGRRRREFLGPAARLGEELFPMGSSCCDEFAACDRGGTGGVDLLSTSGTWWSTGGVESSFYGGGPRDHDAWSGWNCEFLSSEGGGFSFFRLAGDEEEEGLGGLGGAASSSGVFPRTTDNLFGAPFVVDAADTVLRKPDHRPPGLFRQNDEYMARPTPGGSRRRSAQTSTPSAPSSSIPLTRHGAPAPSAPFDTSPPTTAPATGTAFAALLRNRTLVRDCENAVRGVNCVKRTLPPLLQSFFRHAAEIGSVVSRLLRVSKALRGNAGIPGSFGSFGDAIHTEVQTFLAELERVEPIFSDPCSLAIRILHACWSRTLQTIFVKK